MGLGGYTGDFNAGITSVSIVYGRANGNSKLDILDEFILIEATYILSTGSIDPTNSSLNLSELS